MQKLKCLTSSGASKHGKAKKVQQIHQQHCFVLILMRRRKILFPAGTTVCVESTHSPRVCMGFLWVLRFPLVSVCACVRVSLRWKGDPSRWVPALHPKLLREARATCYPEVE